MLRAYVTMSIVSQGNTNTMIFIIIIVMTEHCLSILVPVHYLHNHSPLCACPRAWLDM